MLGEVRLGWERSKDWTKKEKVGKDWDSLEEFEKVWKCRERLEKDLRVEKGHERQGKEMRAMKDLDRIWGKKNKILRKSWISQKSLQ